MRRTSSSWVVPLLVAGAATTSVLGAEWSQAPERWAVIVGVNDYAAFGPDDPGGDLLGAEHDARSFREVLRGRWGFAPERTRLLVGSEATKDAIREALAVWLPARVTPGDEVVFYFAGHGAQVLDEDGDEPDGLDETLCPWDVLADSPINDIRDDELRTWLAAIPTRNVSVVVDACHSGTVTRLHSSLRPRRLGRSLEAVSGGLAPRGDVAPRAVEPSESFETGVVEFTAAAPWEAALEGPFGTDERGEPVAGGIFTAHLVRALWEAPARATYDMVYRRVAAAMRAGQIDQVPQLSGEIDRPVFGGVAENEEPMTVSQHDGDRVTLSNGPAPVLAPGTRLVTRSGAVIRIRGVSGASALGRLEAGVVSVGEEALLDSIAFVTELRVDPSQLAEPARSLLRQRATSTESISLVAGPLVPPHLTLISADSGGIALLGQDGRERRRIPEGRELVDELWRALEQELVLRELAALKNPGSAFAVEVEAVGGPYEVEGEISFRVKSGRAGYLTLLDVGTSGSVSILYPNPFEELGRVAPGEWLEIPGPQAQFTIEGPVGVGAVRAIVTDRPLPLGREPGSFLTEQQGRKLSAAVLQMLRVSASPGPLG